MIVSIHSLNYHPENVRNPPIFGMELHGDGGEIPFLVKEGQFLQKSTRKDEKVNIKNPHGHLLIFQVQVLSQRLNPLRGFSSMFQFLLDSNPFFWRINRTSSKLT